MPSPTRLQLEDPSDHRTEDSHSLLRSEEPPGSRTAEELLDVAAGAARRPEAALPRSLLFEISAGRVSIEELVAENDRASLW